jgi:hypothetical protein
LSAILLGVKTWPSLDSIERILGALGFRIAIVRR